MKHNATNDETAIAFRKGKPAKKLLQVVDSGTGGSKWRDYSLHRLFQTLNLLVQKRRVQTHALFDDHKEEAACVLNSEGVSLHYCVPVLVCQKHSAHVLFIFPFFCYSSLHSAPHTLIPLPRLQMPCHNAPGLWFCFPHTMFLSV